MAGVDQVSGHGHQLTSIPNPGPLNAPVLTKVCYALVVLGLIGFITALLGVYQAVHAARGQACCKA